MSYWETDRQTDRAWEKEKEKYRYKKSEIRHMKKMRGDMETEDKEKKVVYREKVDQETRKRKESSDRTDEIEEKNKG